MYRPRIIPTLLISGDALVKSVKFKNHQYIGDPINTARLFDEFGADEVILLDIMASKVGQPISSSLVEILGDELKIPFAVGGGITELEQIEERLRCGAERVVLNTIALKNHSFVKAAVRHFGSSTIAVCIDVKKVWLRGNRIFSHVSSKSMTFTLEQYLAQLQELAVGEIIIQSVDRDGTMSGYDTELVSFVNERCTCSVVALGGAGCVGDLYKMARFSPCSGVAAGSLFVYGSKMRGVLVNYPSLDLSSLRR
jgi:cyclase